MAQIEDRACFINTLKQEAIPRTKYSRLLEDFIVYSAVLDRIIIIPKGMVCDAESFFIKSSDEAGWVHDYLYRKNAITWKLGCLTWNNNLFTIDNDFKYMCRNVNRRLADKVFEEMSIVDDVSCGFSWVKWLAVRIGGHWCWHRYHVMQDISKLS
jgi:hypothetical protein